jgi:aconitate hydratase
VAGVLTDPRTLDLDYPVVEMPAQFLVDDRMFIFPWGPDASVAVYRGPNIGDPPQPQPLVESLSGVVTIVLGDKITTDDITPAGQYLKYRSNIPRYAQAVFERVDPTFAERAARNRDAGLHNVVVAGESYGQGSSREHAAICPMYLGVKAVIAKSYERIHTANLINFGIVPLTFADPEDYRRIEPGDAVQIPGIRAKLERGELLQLIDVTQGIEIPLSYELSPRQRDLLVGGGVLGKRVSFRETA